MVSRYRQQLEGDGGVICCQNVRHLLAVVGVAPCGEQMQLVTPLGKQTDRRLKVPEESEMCCGKEDLQMLRAM